MKQAHSMRYETYVIEKERLFSWIEDLQRDQKIVGPVREDDRSAFREIDSMGELSLDYGLTMTGPQSHVFSPTESLCTIHREGDGYRVDYPDNPPPQVLLGVHSCDLHAILVLDKVFLRGPHQDRQYRVRREKTLLIGVHCTGVHPQCFCASMGTGPHFEPKEVYDYLLTDLGDSFLVETLGERALDLLAPMNPQKAHSAHFQKKEELRLWLLDQFVKKLDTRGLAEAVLRNQDHPVWRRTAEERCLGCTNCTMVCPTCFCFNTKDHVSFDLEHCERIRYKDSCQELHFAEVHGGNMRETRKARLRQFVTHKLATWWEQFGCFGCVGCGRCMTWCPTKIDLTVMAEEILDSERNNRGETHA